MTWCNWNLCVWERVCFFFWRYIPTDFSGILLPKRLRVSSRSWGCQLSLVAKLLCLQHLGKSVLLIRWSFSWHGDTGRAQDGFLLAIQLPQCIGALSEKKLVEFWAKLIISLGEVKPASLPLPFCLSSQYILRPLTSFLKEKNLSYLRLVIPCYFPPVENPLKETLLTAHTNPSWALKELS